MIDMALYAGTSVTFMSAHAWPQVPVMQGMLQPVVRCASSWCQRGGRLPGGSSINSSLRDREQPGLER